MWEREELLDCGLGDQKITFTDMECSAEEYKEILVDHFPKLSEGGGYELMRCCPNSRQLECISSNALKSPKATQERVGRSKVYIRPIQRDLDTTPLEDMSNSQTNVSCLEGIPDMHTFTSANSIAPTLYVVHIIMWVNFAIIMVSCMYTYVWAQSTNLYT